MHVLGFLKVTTLNKAQSHWFSSPGRRREKNVFVLKYDSGRRASVTGMFPALSSLIFSHCWRTRCARFYDCATLRVGAPYEGHNTLLYIYSPTS